MGPYGPFLSATDKNAMMTISTGVQAVAEYQYGRTEEALWYVDKIVDAFNRVLPGSISEMMPDYGDLKSSPKRYIRSRYISNTNVEANWTTLLDLSCGRKSFTSAGNPCNTFLVVKILFEQLQQVLFRIHWTARWYCIVSRSTDLLNYNKTQGQVAKAEVS